MGKSRNSQSNKKVPNIFEENKEYIVKAYADVVDFPKWVRNKTNELILDSVSDNIDVNKKKLKILDIGAGQGDFDIPLLEYLSNQKVTWEFWGFDISSKMIASFQNRVSQNPLLADKRELIHLWVDDAREGLNIDTSNFDIIIITHVLHYLPNWRELLTEVKRNMNEGGILVQETSKGYYSCLAGIFKHLLNVPESHLKLWKTFFSKKKLEWTPTVDLLTLQDVKEFVEKELGLLFWVFRSFVWYKEISLDTAIKWIEYSPVSSIGAGLTERERQEIAASLRNELSEKEDLGKLEKVPFWVEILIHKKFL